MRGLNRRVKVKRLNETTEKWSVIFPKLLCRITDKRETRSWDDAKTSTTEYTHIMFIEYQLPYPVQIEDQIEDTSEGLEYAVVGVVNAAGANHHLEIRLRRMGKD